MDASKAGQTLKIHCSAQRPDVCRWLSPFILSCCVYFCLWIPEDQLSWFAALIKCLPVLCLAGFLWIMSPSGGYTRLLQGALVCSAVGDACLIWPEAFLPDSASEDLTGSKLLSKTLFDFCIHDVLSVTHSREATSPSMRNSRRCCAHPPQAPSSPARTQTWGKGQNAGSVFLRKPGWLVGMRRGGTQQPSS
ncbi:lysoplasmalogenase TMEM86B isoform X3 [Pongo abelii]|uniref:lysoplasmalogenase TMEM86B isoform X3 n=1 Tax=Pongo abelii TaxID=9601 RepID=UPI0023E7B605|nr:lysoplasmalogenase isoform X3 [Pongo abelii]